MRIDSIISLEAIINNNTPETLSQQINATAIEMRLSKEASITEALRNKQILFQQAMAFKQWESTSPIEITPAMATLLKMGHWFSIQTHLDNYRSFSVHAFSSYFDVIIPDSIDPVSIITLGKAFIPEPAQYAGYLFWLLNNGANPRDIEDSRIAHQFFAYHIAQEDVIEETYLYLQELNEQADSFLKYFQTASCGMRGFINNPINVEIFQPEYCSHNLLGSQFRHFVKNQLKNSENTMNRAALNQDLTFDKDTGTAFFQLFGWEFIEALRPTYYEHLRIIENLLQSKEAISFLNIFTDKVLSGEINTNKASALIKIIKQSFWKAPAGLTESEKLTALEENPFLIHTLSQYDYFVNHFPFKLQQLKADRYKSTHHVPHLCNLYARVKAIAGIEQKHKNTLLDFIFSIITPFGNTLSDEIRERLLRLHEDLHPLYYNFLNNYKNELKDIIDKYAVGEIDLSVVENFWGEHLSTTNLLIDLDWELKDEVTLPYGKYELYHEVIESISALNTHEESNTRRQDFASNFSDNQDLLDRVFQLALTKTNSSKTITLIIDSFPSSNAFIDFCFKPTNHNRKSLFEHALFFANPTLFSRIIAKAKQTDMTAKVYEHIQKWFSHYLERTDYFHSKRYHYTLETITLLLSNIPDYLPIKKMVRALFIRAVELRQEEIIIFFLELGHTNPIKKCDIKTALLDSTNFNQHNMHDVALLLCGMTEHQFNKQIVIKNNLGLYFSFILKTIKLNENNPTFRNKNLNHFYYCNNNILHLAAQNKNLTVIKAVFSALEKQCTSDEICYMLIEENDQLKIPHAKGQSPTALQINNFLDRQRQHYQILEEAHSPVTGFSQHTQRLFYATQSGVLKRRDRPESEIETLRVRDDELMTQDSGGDLDTPTPRSEHSRFFSSSSETSDNDDPHTPQPEEYSA